MSTDSGERRRYPEAGKRRAEKPAGWFRRHKWLSISLAVFVVLAVAGGGYLYALNAKLANIDRFDSNLVEEGRPDPAPGQALNILLLGEDNDGEVHRSDTIIVVHIPEDRERAYLVSLPRDSYVEIYDENNQPQGMNKINAAYSLFGAPGTQATVEQLTDMRMDHVAILDWAGFKDLSEAVGGVRVYIPETFTDPKQNVTWEEGWTEVEGDLALKYVRTRYGLSNGDFGRIERQQNFMRALMGQLLASGTMSNPIKLNNALEAITRNLTVDDDWETGDMRDLAFNMRGLDSDRVKFVTAPLGGYDDTDVGSVVLLDPKQSKELFAAVRNDKMGGYLKKYPDESLGDDRSIG